mgnify:CR=1 FL=1
MEPQLSGAAADVQQAGVTIQGEVVEDPLVESVPVQAEAVVEVQAPGQVGAVGVRTCCRYRGSWLISILLISPIVAMSPRPIRTQLLAYEMVY